MLGLIKPKGIPSYTALAFGNKYCISTYCTGNIRLRDIQGIKDLGLARTFGKAS